MSSSLLEETFQYGSETILLGGGASFVLSACAMTSTAAKGLAMGAAAPWVLLGVGVCMIGFGFWLAWKKRSQ